jgi:hypothetical protein
MPGSYFFGKKPAKPEMFKLKFGDFLDRTAARKELPAHPTGPFGHDLSIKPGDWGMLGNDMCGDCVWAGAAHETKMIAGMAKKQVWFSDHAVLADYSAATGYVPGDSKTDQGTDMHAAAEYRLHTGIQDGHGVRHKILGYASVEPGNIEEHLMALNMFGAVGVGVKVPSYMPTQFDHMVPFDVIRGTTHYVGGHYLPLTSFRDGMMHLVTWARPHPMTAAFLDRFNDESVVYFTDEGMTNRRTPEGFDYDACLAALKTLQNPVA